MREEVPDEATADPDVSRQVPNVMACLVHEPYDCAVDLVRNLNHLAPESLVILYVDRPHFRAFVERWRVEPHLRAVLHPAPRPVPVCRTLARTWRFALDVMRFAVGLCHFDALTIVESDQLLVRHGFADEVTAVLARHPRCGLLGSSQVATPQGPDSEVPVAQRAHRELRLWRPVLDEFPGGSESFVHYSFWPSLVIAGRAVSDLLRWTDSHPSADALVASSETTAIAELLLPTLVRLLGWEVLPSPGSYRHCHWRQQLGLEEVGQALSEADCYWIHPVARHYDDPVRAFVRHHHGAYGRH